MNTIEIKRPYTAPELQIVKLDNDISLALASGDLPPAGPGEAPPSPTNNNPWQ